MKSKILVTGGAGFIGSAFVRLALSKNYRVVVVDKLTYAGDLARLKEFEGDYTFYKADICDKSRVTAIVKKEDPIAIVNFAAETHVDRSILDASAFIETNIKGVQSLLEVVRQSKIRRFLQVSTDEVYGEIKKGSFSEFARLSPNNPYAASKASADLLIKSYIRTYKVPAVIVRPCNNYGPWQYPEKFIPVIIAKALAHEHIPVYAQGLNRREWLYVNDCAEGILCVLNKGEIGEWYNLGSGEEWRNIDLVKCMLSYLRAPQKLITFVQDRPGHDFRYSLNSCKVNMLGWKPNVVFDQGILSTMRWYVEHLSWILKKKCQVRKHWDRVYITK